MYRFLNIVESLAFFVFLISVGYLFFFSFFSLWRTKKKSRKILNHNNFLIIIPAYKEDNVIFDSVTSLLVQDYPFSLMNIVVVSDKMSDTTNLKLSELPIQLLVVANNNESSSKANALKYAMSNTEREDYNSVVIIDADNMVNPNFLAELNIAFNNGSMAVQAHRRAKNTNTPMAVLDAISEEINNSIFRKGHVNAGLSSALIGSGMAFEYKWFKNNVYKLNTAGEDKELERLLLKDRVYIDYLDSVPVYDEKVQKIDTFYNQRRRWIASQAGSLAQGIRDLPTAIFQGNINHINKIFQHMLLPRVVLLGLLGFISITATLIDWRISIKWWILLLLLLLTFAMAIPDEYVNKKTIKAMKMLPLIFIMMVINFFRIKGVNQKFIHTKKGES